MDGAECELEKLTRKLAASSKDHLAVPLSLLVRIHFIIVMIRWTGLAPCEFEFPFPGSLTSTFLIRWRTSCARGASLSLCLCFSALRVGSNRVFPSP